MKKFYLLLLSLLLVLSLSACGKEAEDSSDSTTKTSIGSKTLETSYEATTLKLNSDGTISQYLVEDFDESTYNAEEFEKFVKDEISDFTAENGSNAVSLSSLEIANGVAKVNLLFSGDSTYAKFEGVSFSSGTVSELMIDGYDFEQQFSSVTAGLKDSEEGNTDKDEATHNVLGKVLVIGEDIQVEVPGTLTFVSAKGTSILSQNTVSCHVDDASNGLIYIFYE